MDKLIQQQYSEIPIGRAEDLTNKQFGRWTVLYRTNNDIDNKTKWVC